jgi:hypothetical protein
VPQETAAGGICVAATPATAKPLIGSGYDVVVERGAGVLAVAVSALPRPLPSTAANEEDQGVPLLGAVYLGDRRITLCEFADPEPGKARSS